MLTFARQLPFRAWLANPSTSDNPAQDSEGYPIPIYPSPTNFVADVQPIRNVKRTIERFGKDTVNPDSRIMYGKIDQVAFLTYSHLVEALDGVVSPNRGIIYEVVGIQPWYYHIELLLEPSPVAVPVETP